VKSLLWQAGCAGAFMRRTERLLEPAQWLTAAKDDLQLLHQDQRLEKIAEIPDPYRRLNGVLARLSASVAPAEQANAGVLRRLPRTLSSNVNRLAARGPIGSAAFSPSDSVMESQGSDLSANTIPSTSRLEPPRRAVTPVIPAYLDGPNDGRITSHSSSGEQGTDRASAPARSEPSGPWQSPAAAAREWRERLNDAVMQRAFQTPVRMGDPGDSPVISHSLMAVTTTRSASPVAQQMEHSADTGTTDSRRVESPAFPVERDSPNLEPQSNPPQRRPLEWPSIASSAACSIEAVPRPTTGLRRLAALATEPLDDPDPAPSLNPLRTSPETTSEEFERLLRREAERHGIDLEGAIR
jgi:hypothetical protein